MHKSLLYNSRITRVKFSIIGDETILKDSCSNVVSYDLFHDEVPIDGGLYNLHMGTTSYKHKCKTCFNKKTHCLGHDGHYNLNYPILSPLCISEIKKWLKLICHKCGNPIIKDKLFMHFKPLKRLDEAQKIARTGLKNCAWCKEPHPVIKKDPVEPLSIISEKYSDKHKIDEEFLYPHKIKEIFEKISPATVLKMGKPLDSHPKNFILSVIKIPSNTSRPNTDVSTPRGQDSKDVTTMIQLIMKKNASMPTIIPDNIEPKVRKSIYDLNNTYYELIKASGDGAINSYSSSLRGKQGIPRKNMMGKRVHDIGRTTIVGDVTLGINEVGVPLKFAKTIQIEEPVQDYNRRQLMTYIQNMGDKYPGCTEIYKYSTGKLRIVNNPIDVDLEPGDILYRDMITGDPANYNRQPSLKISAISGMKQVICENPSILTLRMNVIACPLFDADFDGDQMNLILNSSICGRNEINTLSALSNWLISHTNSSPSIGQVDDSIIGLFELTASKVKLNKYHAMLLFNNTKYIPDFSAMTYDTGKTVSAAGEYTGGGDILISGRECISKILEETPINYSGVPSKYYDEKLAPYMQYDPSDIKVTISRGKHVSGVLDKTSIGKGATGGIYHIMCNEYGPEKTLDVMFNMQQMAIAYILQAGYTIGIMDLLVSDSAKVEIDKIAADIINKSNIVTDKLNRGEIIPPIGMTVEEFYEQQQIACLRAGDDFIEPVLGSVDPKRNNLLKLIQSGSKGTIDNMFNMVSSIGQKLINGERIRQKFGHKRTLAYFPRYDTTPESRGYIINSYISGMNSSEYVFNAMNARFDIISKALSTSVTGEQNRKSIKNLESIIINNFRFATKHVNIIQLLYGEDGLDPRAVEKVKFPTVNMGDNALNAKYKIDTKNKTLQDLVNEQTKRIKSDRDKYRKIFMQIENMNINEKMSDSRLMPVNLERIIIDILREYESTGVKAPTEEELIVMGGYVDNLCDILPYVLLNEIQERDKRHIPEHLKKSVWLLSMLIRSHLHVALLTKINMEILDIIIKKVRLVFSSALIDPGTAAGIIAAQSFSGPLTQYVLDAHHRSATGGTSKTGMTRAKEILAVRDIDKLQSPSMHLCVLSEYETDQGFVQEVANNIEVMKLEQFVTSYQIFYEKFNEPVHSKYKHETAIINEFLKMNPLLTPPGDLLKWCIRLVINKTTLILKNMSLELIVSKIRESYPDIYVVYTPENAKNIIVRLYMRNSMKDIKGNVVFKGSVETNNMIMISKEILSMVIRGVDGITNAIVKTVSRSYIDAATGEIKSRDIYTIETVGTNFEGVLHIKYIDPLRIQTDAIMEMYRMLGVEAARQKIVSELRSLSPCNHRHYLIYADEMTRTGHVTSIERSGLSVREASNYLLRIGFSSPIQTLEEAGLNAVTDEVTGVTAPLLVGSVPKIGTLYNQMHIDPNMVAKYMKKPDDILDLL
jgi:DNA-directed RNA polymerase II subunit RPB1